MNKQKIESLLESVDIRLNGSRPWDIQVRDERMYGKLMAHGSLGLGEAYMDGWWDAAALDQFFCRILRSGLERNYAITPRAILDYLGALFANLQNPSRAYANIKHHYDIGNDLYKAMLDKRMVYTGAYWNGARNLDEAQQTKLEMVCRKLDLRQGQRILDIGCGWGSFAKYAAENYGVNVVGITISREQVELGKELCKGLPVEIRLQDYRELNEKFDHIVSLGMIEHVGYKNYKTYFEIVSRSLSDNGIFLLQTIGGNISMRSSDPWLNKYIFPNSMLPSIKQIAQAIESRFVMEDWHNFGTHYDKTLMAWFQNFDGRWDSLKNNYSDRFYRMWKYYLLSCAGAFRSRKVQLWQIALSKNGLEEGFNALRHGAESKKRNLDPGEVLSDFVKIKRPLLTDFR
ncbi:MAG: cyclopropane fatty acyl phospholipid synthase [Eubacteriaceae bacterium]|nr:cyclopropane fatty acyl phospholipid synthase [Eubacteriaceae bacterium]